MLSRGKAADGRASLFHADEIERLARRGRPRRPPGVADITVESAITEITGDRLRFRGLDVTRLAVSHTFEEVAELLWTGELRSAREPWQARPAALTAGRAAQAALPAGTLPLERFQVIVPAMAATDPLRLQLEPAAVLAAGRSIIAGMVDCLPVDVSSGSVGSSRDEPVAGRLWSRLGQGRPSPGLLRAMSAALVLLADHELAASTLAARVAASVRADPYALEAYAGPGPLRPRAVYIGKPGRRRPVTDGPGGYSPVAPSICSRSRSAWPRCRAYSSIMCR